MYIYIYIYIYIYEYAWTAARSSLATPPCVSTIFFSATTAAVQFLGLSIPMSCTSASATSARQKPAVAASVCVLLYQYSK